MRLWHSLERQENEHPVIELNIPEERSSVQHNLTLECGIAGHIVHRNNFNPLPQQCSVNESTVFLNRENEDKTKEVLGPILPRGAIVGIVCVCVFGGGGRWNEMVASLCSCGPRT
jgi:hypothetical protein